MPTQTLSPLQQEANTALSSAWVNVQAEGMAFGRACYEWKVKLGEDIYPLYKKIGIAASVAEWWMEKYTTSIGMRTLHKERVQHRALGDQFEEIRKRALKMLSIGYAVMLKEEKESPRNLLAAKDWAHARLKARDMEVSPAPALDGEAKPAAESHHA